MASSLPPSTHDEESPYKDLSGQVTTEKYRFVVGGFADIFRGEWKDPSTSGKVVQVAVKMLRGVHNMEPESLEVFNRHLNRETRVWHRLSDSNILPFFGLCYDLDPCPSMISPRYDNGDVLKYLVKKPKEDRLKIVIGVARGLKYLHASDVIHGDLKGRNILIDDDGCPRLCDFGQSKLIGIAGFTATKFAGSVRYLAPELLPTESEDVLILTRETDVYAFSMAALEILSGKQPFFDISWETVVIAKVQSGKRPEQSLYLPMTFTDPLWMLLVKCWDQDKARRPSMKSVVESLEHDTEGIQA